MLEKRVVADIDFSRNNVLPGAFSKATGARAGTKGWNWFPR